MANNIGASDCINTDLKNMRLCILSCLLFEVDLFIILLKSTSAKSKIESALHCPKILSSEGLTLLFSEQQTALRVRLNDHLSFDILYHNTLVTAHHG